MGRVPFTSPPGERAGVREEIPENLRREESSRGSTETPAPYGVIRRRAVPPRRVHARDHLRGWTGAWLSALRALRARTYKELHACTHERPFIFPLSSPLLSSASERGAVKSRARECLGNICRNSSVCRTRSSWRSLLGALRIENVKLKRGLFRVSTKHGLEIGSNAVISILIFSTESFRARPSRLCLAQRQAIIWGTSSERRFARQLLLCLAKEELSFACQALSLLHSANARFDH